MNTLKANKLLTLENFQKHLRNENAKLLKKCNGDMALMEVPDSQKFYANLKVINFINENSVEALRFMLAE